MVRNRYREPFCEVVLGGLVGLAVTICSVGTLVLGTQVCCGQWQNCDGELDGLVEVSAWEVGTIDGLEEVGISVGAFDGAVVYIIVYEGNVRRIIRTKCQNVNYARRKQHPQLAPPVWQSPGRVAWFAQAHAETVLQQLFMSDVIWSGFAKPLPAFMHAWPALHDEARFFRDPP